MPSTYPTLQKKFFVNGSDGINEAERILLDAGYTIDNCHIKKPKEHKLEKNTVGEIIDALHWLLYEWDYSTD